MLAFEDGTKVGERRERESFCLLNFKKFALRDYCPIKKKKESLNLKALKKGHSDIFHLTTMGCLEDLISSGAVPAMKVAITIWFVIYWLN